MEKNKILALNHKMNMNLNDLANYIKEINIDNYSLVVFPMSIYLPYFLNKKFKIGIQNISSFEEGSYTGEVSAKASKSLGVNYALIGHSERREFLNEDNQDINKKIKMALKYNLKVILCVGEKSKDEDKEELLSNQLEEAFQDVNHFNKVIIAYEPIWAIGTGVVPTNEEIFETTKFIKDKMLKMTKSNIKVIYGGSVNDKNIEELNRIENIDGYLVGGASLDFKKVLDMIKVV